MVKVKDLKDQTGQTGPHAIFHCSGCGGEYSANSGDYFNCPVDMVFECCGMPMSLVIKRIIYEPV